MKVDFVAYEMVLNTIMRDGIMWIENNQNVQNTRFWSCSISRTEFFGNETGKNLVFSSKSEKFIAIQTLWVTKHVQQKCPN